jgi:rod shape-determining protein MreD
MGAEMTRLPVRLKVTLLLGVVLVLQTSVLSDWRIRHVCPDAMLLITIAAGVVGGEEAGAAVGFASGLLADLFLQTPIGLSALVLALIGFGVGAVQGGVLRASRWIPLLTALVASAVGVVLFALVGAMLGQTQLLTPGVRGLGRIAGLVAAMNAIGALPMVAAMRWAMRDASVARSPALR